MPGSLLPCLKVGGLGLPADSQTILLAGDSRVHSALDPFLLTKILEVRTRNIADPIQFGGNLSTLSLVMSHLTPMERSRIALVISDVTGFGLDDGNATTLSGTEFNHYTLWNQIQLALKGPRLFFRMAIQNFWPNQLRAWRGKRTPPPQSCSVRHHLPERVHQQLGYLPINHATRPLGKDSLDKHSPEVFGIRYQQGLDRIREIIKMKVPLILFFPPIDKRFCNQKYRKILCEYEYDLPKQMIHDIPELQNRIIDCVNHPPSGIEDGHFVDIYHLDLDGAQILSQALIDSLVSRGIFNKKATASR